MNLSELLDAKRRLPGPSVCKFLREANSLSQKPIAQEAGVSVATLSRWEAGRRNPSGKRLIRYVEILDRLRAELRSRGDL